MDYRMAAISMTLSGLQGHAPFKMHFFHTVVEQLTRFQLA